MAKIDLSKYGGKPVALSKYGAAPVEDSAAASVQAEGEPMPVQPGAQYTSDGEVVDWPTVAPVSEGAAAARGFSQGLTSNWSDELLGRFAQAFPSTNVSLERVGEQWGDIAAGRIPRAGDQPNLRGYEENRDYWRNINSLSAHANPKSFGGGAVVGGILQAASPVGKATFLGQPGVGAGIASGALAGAGMSSADNVEGVAEDAETGAQFGALASILSPYLTRPIASASSWLGGKLGLGRGLVHPTPEAQALLDRDVPLTLGQQDPKSSLGVMEAVGANTGVLGPQIRRLREAGAEGIQRAAVNEGLPPGMVPADPDMPLQAQQARAYEGFEGAYAPTRSIEVPPYATEVVPGRTAPSGQPLNRVVNLETGFERAAQDANVTATAEIRETVDKFLKNQLTLLPPQAFDAGGRVTVGTLQALRSNIRDQIRKALAGASPNYEKAGLLANAEEHVTSVLEAHLPEQARAALRAADQQYAKHKIVEGAMAQAGDRPSGFSPFNLEQSIKKGTERGGFARGTSGGPLRDISSAGRAVLEAPPPTGMQPLIAGAPGVANFITAPAALAANTIPAVRRAALGQTEWQGALRNLVSPQGAQEAMSRMAQGGARGEFFSNAARPPAASLKALASNPQAMGKYGPELQRAQAQGDDALITYDFMKASTDPEYQRLKREAAGAPAP